MKYLIYGTDHASRKKEITSLEGDLLKKGFELVRMTDDIFDETLFMQQVSGGDLFGQKKALVLSYCLSTKDTRHFLDSKKEEIEKTDTPIIFVEDVFLKKDFPSFKKVFEKVSEHKSVASKEVSRFNVFGLVDAIVSKDRKKSWLLFQEAQKENVSSEEIIGLLFWQYKNLLLVAGGATSAALKMKPFVFNKAKRFAKNYSQKELQQKLFSLVKLFEKGRFEKDSQERLEKFILN